MDILLNAHLVSYLMIHQNKHEKLPGTTWKSSNLQIHLQSFFANNNKIFQQSTTKYTQCTRYVRNAAELELMLLELQTNNKIINVICFTEHFIMQGHKCNLQLNNYRLATSYTHIKRRGSCILLREGIEQRYLKNKQISNKYYFACCAIEVITNSLITVCIYQIGNKQYTSLFFKLTKVQILNTNLKKQYFVLISIQIYLRK